MMTPEVHNLLTEAAKWRLLGLMFEYPAAEWRRQLETLLPDLRDETLLNIASGALEHSTEGLHIALFGPGGSVPAREVTYLGGVQFGYLMAELAAFYEAFGYQPSTNEAGDHVSVEAGFIAYLKLKQAYALASGDVEHAMVAGEAAGSFIKEHLALVAEPMLVTLRDFAPDYLVRAGEILLELTGPSPRTVHPPGGADDDEELSCGPASGAAELIQLDPR
jgi:nitrate reductase assembly molybdenum cofactor insertion protein NarJ